MLWMWISETYRINHSLSVYIFLFKKPTPHAIHCNSLHVYSSVYIVIFLDLIPTFWFRLPSLSVRALSTERSVPRLRLCVSRLIFQRHKQIRSAQSISCQAQAILPPCSGHWSVLPSRNQSPGCQKGLYYNQSHGKHYCIGTTEVSPWWTLTPLRCRNTCPLQPLEYDFSACRLKTPAPCFVGIRLHQLHCLIQDSSKLQEFRGTGKLASWILGSERDWARWTTNSITKPRKKQEFERDDLSSTSTEFAKQCQSGGTMLCNDWWWNQHFSSKLFVTPAAFSNSGRDCKAAISWGVTQD